MNLLMNVLLPSDNVESDQQIQLRNEMVEKGDQISSPLKEEEETTVAIML